MKENQYRNRNNRHRFKKVNVDIDKWIEIIQDWGDITGPNQTWEIRRVSM